MTDRLPVWLKPEAVTAWHHLAGTLAELADAGRTTPCQVDRNPFTDDQPELRREAVAACAGCLAVTACGAFADANREPHGVWGGRDRAPLSKPKPARQETTTVIDVPDAPARRTDRRNCDHCQATAAGCRSHKWLSGRLCCDLCPGDHDGGASE